METAPKIEPIGTIRRNDLFQKNSLIFTFTLHKSSKIEQIKSHCFYHFLPLKCHSLQRKRVKCLLGLKVFFDHFLPTKCYIFKCKVQNWNRRPQWLNKSTKLVPKFFWYFLTLFIKILGGLCKKIPKKCKKRVIFNFWSPYIDTHYVWSQTTYFSHYLGCF